MKLLVLFLMIFSANILAEDPPGPKVELVDVDSLPREYLAQEAKEACQGNDHAIQVRADRLCYYFGHLRSVKNGFTIADNVELDYMMRVHRRDPYSLVEIDTKIYECKKPGSHKKMLRPWKFLKINCLTE